MNSIIFLIQCPDQKGLVSGISTFFYQRGFNITHCQQYTDTQSNQYFMRLVLNLEALNSSRREMEESFQEYGAQFNLRWSVHYTDYREKVAILVTKASHCLYDLLVRQQAGELKCDIPLIISNHPDLESVAEKFRIPFHCLPVNKTNKAEQETRVLQLLQKSHVDLVVLARYMQILSQDFVRSYAGKIINIHHAFLPAFQGANAYQKAYERGVKMIGATSHYATAELDEGPIIEQDVARVTHEHTPEELSRIGRDVERVVLARAVKAHLEQRVITTGVRTIVFSTGV